MRLLIELTYGLCQCRSCRVDRLEWLWCMPQADPGLSWSASRPFRQSADIHMRWCISCPRAAMIQISLMAAVSAAIVGPAGPAADKSL